MQEREAAEHGLACTYKLLDLDKPGLTADALPELLTHAEASGYAGLNITYPCKQKILPLLTELSEDARALGAVNTVVFREGKRIGHNTDWWAFAESFRRGMAGAPMGRVVQLGAGGAGAATAYAALRLGAGEVRIFDRIPERAAGLAAKLQARFGDLRVRTADDLAAAMTDADGIIHATPTGMAKHPGLALDASLLRPELWLAEVVYFPLETELLRVAKGLGCRTLNGAGMAVYQAVLAFRLFTGLEADAERMQRHFLSMGETA
jgi:shikimate dehydrogenase